MYNPYDMVPMVINGVEMQGRPVEFDSDIADFDKMENAFGKLVKPKKLTTVCPNCGQGLEVHVVMGDPPFSPVEYTCEHCTPPKLVVNDPFNNPIESGRVPSSELDPLLHDLNEQIVPATESVGDRVDVDNIAEALGEPAETGLLDVFGEASEGSPGDSGLEVDEDLVTILESKESKEKKPEGTKKAAPKKKTAKKKAAPKKKAPKKKTEKKSTPKPVQAEELQGLEEDFDDSDLAEE